MARIKDASVEAVKQAADIVALVEARTRLRKVGGRYTGLCPFHQERTPSFSVSPDRGTYHCFGCGVGGDAISFVEETEGVDFVGAIEWLADRFSVPLEYDESSPAADARAEAARAAVRAARAGDGVLRAVPLGERGRRAGARIPRVARAARSRSAGSSASASLRGGNSLVRKAREKGFTQAELAAAGLLSRRGGDYFANRLMFPLADARGRVVGFQARKLREDDPLRGKYVNSPEGELFHKSAILYGLHLARAAIAKQDRALVVEGNTDVIALRQAGLEPVVASMGTALTEQQLKELARLTQRLYLCFDADAAGEEATLRGMELALQRELRREGRVAAARARTRPTIRRASRRGSTTAESYRGAPRPARVSTRARQERRLPARARRSSTASPSRPSGRRRGGCERPRRDDRAAARGRRPDDGRRRGVAAAARRERAARAERARRRARAPEPRPDRSPSSGRSTSTTRCTSAPCPCSLGVEDADRS